MDLKVMFFAFIFVGSFVAFARVGCCDFGFFWERERVRLRSAYDTQLLYDFILGSLARCRE